MAQAISRDYEVSIWTLQDEFISVLKPTGVVNKGQIESPTMRLVDDGTQEFHFSIPMYIFLNGKRVFNPIWKNVQNGNVIADMRKIKVTFNRERGEQKTFEFLITDVTERHETDQLYCDVNCEGMAFHELGKRGYKINLLSEDFILENNDYFDRTLNSTGGLKVPIQPKATLSYWLDKFLPRKPIRQQDCDARTWYYDIRMDWSSYANGSQRKRDEVYEEEFVSSWNLEKDENDNDVYVSGTTESAKIKERLVDLKESNIYNLTQDLAENFGVYCRYEYEHDENLEIIGRTIVFYNNYMKENEGYIDITYPYETKAVTRVRDSKELTTKMFVTSVEDPNSESGVLTIMDVPANKSREDYILNFDYLHKIGGITEEQYKAIESYEAEIGKINRDLFAITGPLISLQNQITDLTANIAERESSIDVCKDQQGWATSKMTNLSNNGEGGIEEYTADNPDNGMTVVSSDDPSNYYVTISKEGIKAESLHIYVKKTVNSKLPITTSEFNELTGQFEYDEKTGCVNKVSHLNIDTITTVYLCYKYSPWEYWDNVRQTYANRQNIDETQLKILEKKLDSANKKIKDYERRQESLLNQKTKLIEAFEDMMGPALRESYWQPDEYNDYGDNYLDQNLAFATNTTSTIVGESGYTQTIWDKEPFNDELISYYEEGLDSSNNKKYYPMIDISDKLDFVKKYFDKLSVMFYDFSMDNNNDSRKQPKALRQFVLGSTAQYGFTLKNNRIIPVIVVTGASTLVGGKDYQGDKQNLNSLYRLFNPKITTVDAIDYDTRIGVVETNIVNGKVNVRIVDSLKLTTSSWVNYSATADYYTTAADLYYPRIKIGSMLMKTAEDQLGLKYNGNSLTIYEDYYLLSRDDSTWTTDANPVLETADSAYYITIKPETMMRYGTYTGKVEFKFCISNANIAIYLDAIQVLKENSQPKVSYTVDASFVNTDFIYDLYNKLNRICNINDTELQFENVQGYISSIDIDCDIPSNDKIEVKNYKTKFEDLFSSIVAQTQAMKKSEYAIGLAAGSFTSDGDLTEKAAESVWRRVDLNLAFNKGKLTINDKDGIWGTSDDGVVAFRGGGIFTATKKDDAGNWIWNTGIIPQGINADLITTGQLDTNKINIFSGDNIRFSWNPDGIFAYRDFYLADSKYKTSEVDSLLAAIQRLPDSDARKKQLTDNQGIDAKQFVTLNQEGLFLVAKQGALYLDGNELKESTISQINRVSVSWDGLTIRDWNNTKVFYADTHGDLTVIGHIQASSLTIGSQSIDSYINGKKGIHNGTLNPPKDSDTATLNASVGDLYYNTETHAYWRCVATSGTGRWEGFQLGETYLDINPSDGTINMKAGSIMNLSGTSKIHLESGPSTKVDLTPEQMDFVGSNISLTTANSQGNITMTGGNINMTGGQISLTAGNMTDVEDSLTQYLQTPEKLIFKLSGQPVFSIEKTDTIFRIQPDTYVNDLQVDGELTAGPVTASSINTDELIINDVKFIPNSSNMFFSNIKIIFTRNDGTPNNQGQFPSNEHEVLWIYPSEQGDAPTPQPTEEKVTWTSGKISSRISINSASDMASDAIKFKGSPVSTGDTYDYTAKIKVYGTGTGTRTINTTSTLTINGVTLNLSSAVSLTPGAEKTLVFKKENSPTNITGSSPIQGRITIHTSGSGAYVNLQKDVTNSLIIKNNINSNGTSSISSIDDVKDCVIKYIP